MPSARMVIKELKCFSEYLQNIYSIFDYIFTDCLGKEKDERIPKNAIT